MAQEALTTPKCELRTGKLAYGKGKEDSAQEAVAQPASPSGATAQADFAGVMYGLKRVPFKLNHYQKETTVAPWSGGEIEC